LLLSIALSWHRGAEKSRGEVDSCTVGKGAVYTHGLTTRTAQHRAHHDVLANRTKNGGHGAALCKW
jgi:hypothetical protein